MTAPTYDTLTTDDTGADKILTTGTVTALDQNPVSIAQRGTSAPVAQVPVIEVKTSGTGATWTWPDGVTAATFYLLGGGGGGSGAGVAEAGTDGGDTSITYNNITTTAEGGDGGSGSGQTGRGGNAGGGDLSVNGGIGIGQIGGDSFLGRGGRYIGAANTLAPVNGGGGFAESGGQSGSGGEFVRKRVAKVDGLNTVTYTVGAAGTKYNSSGQDGAGGLLVIEY